MCFVHLPYVTDNIVQPGFGELLSLSYNLERQTMFETLPP